MGASGSHAVHYKFSRKEHCHLAPNGLLSYNDRSVRSGYVPVALLVTRRLIRPNYSNHLEIEIVDKGRECAISVGLVPPGYASGRQPGWDPSSIGYHADDGGIFFEAGRAQCRVGQCKAGDRMGVGVDFSANAGASPRLFFTKNGVQVFEKNWPALRNGSHHFAVGLHSMGEAVHLLHSDMWLAEDEDLLGGPHTYSRAVHYKFSRKEHCHLTPNGLLSYNNRSVRSGNVPVAILVTQRPIRPNYSNHLEIEIIDEGEECTLSVGIVPPDYASGRQPGWDDNSIGYHADDGGIFFGHGFADFDVGKCGAGDRMGVGVKLFENTDESPRLFFTRNGEQVFERNWEALCNGSHQLAVGMHSIDEKARLLDSDMWLADDEFMAEVSPFSLLMATGNHPPPSSTAAYAGAAETEHRPVDAPPGYWDLFSASNKPQDVPQQPGLEENFRFSQKMHCVLDSNGLLSYDERTFRRVPVATLTTHRRIGRDSSNYLEIEIVDGGHKCMISVGIVPPNFAEGRQSGWNINSMGYHAENGGIFVGSGGAAEVHVGQCKAGDRMGVEVLFCDVAAGVGPTVFFTKNGQEVYKKQWRALHDGSHHLAVGMHSMCEKVRLLKSDMWQLENPQPELVTLSDEQGVPVTRQYHFSRKKYCDLSSNGVLRYLPMSNLICRIACLVTQRPIRPIYNNYIEIEIVDPGYGCSIEVGIVPPNYASGSLPGWDPDSVGYHANDGGIFFEAGEPTAHLDKCRAGDRMGVGVIFPTGDSASNATPMFFFTKNGKKVFEKSWPALRNGSHHFVVGMHSKCEAVRLVDSDMWLAEDPLAPSNISAPSLQSSEPQGNPSAIAPPISPPWGEAPPKYEEVAKGLPNPEDDGLPGFWDLSAGNDNGSYRLVSITKNGATYHEYEKIEMQFFETLSRSQFRILSIQRIQNPALYQAFQSCKQKMERRSGPVEEKFVFHGAKQEYVEAICHQGFVSGISGDSTEFQYGRGSYFAKEANYSRHYTDSQQLFVARVLVGHYTKGEPFHEQPPPKDPEHPHGEAFDSCVDDVDNPRIFVVFSIEQAYPEYLVDFQEVE